MSKQAFITRISCLLDRGSGHIDDTSYFNNRPHDVLIEEFQSYIEAHQHLIGQVHTERTQALNDRGTDLIVSTNNYKIGFQIKSHFDVSEAAFAANVKRQATESFAHGLDKWYLLICSPLKDGKTDYSSKISYLINEISSYKTVYIAAYSPLNTIQYFNNPRVVNEETFFLEIQRRSYEQTTIDEILSALRDQNNRHKRLRNRIRDDKTFANPTSPITLERFLGNYYHRLSEEDINATIGQVLPLINRLQELPKRTREFFLALIERSRPRTEGLNSDLCVLAAELQRALHMDHRTFNEEISILERHKFVRLEDDYGQARIDVEWLNKDWPFWHELKEYSKENGVDLKDIIVYLKFSLLD